MGYHINTPIFVFSSRQITHFDLILKGHIMRRYHSGEYEKAKEHAEKV